LKHLQLLVPDLLTYDTAVCHIQLHGFEYEFTMKYSLLNDDKLSLKLLRAAFKLKKTISVLKTHLNAIDALPLVTKK